VQTQRGPTWRRVITLSIHFLLCERVAARCSSERSKCKHHRESYFLRAARWFWDKAALIGHAAAAQRDRSFVSPPAPHRDGKSLICNGWPVRRGPKALSKTFLQPHNARWTNIIGVFGEKWAAKPHDEIDLHFHFLHKNQKLFRLIEEYSSRDQFFKYILQRISLNYVISNAWDKQKALDINFHFSWSAGACFTPTINLCLPPDCEPLLI
jgi:hypothetical protein